MLVKIEDAEGNVLEDKNGNLYVFEIVVKGDVNGDGLANSLDTILIKAARNDVVSLNDAEYSAADINSDGIITISDSRLLLYHRAEVPGYDLNY